MSPRPAHRPSTRSEMLAAAEAHLRAHGTVSLESAAQAAGVTKSGLMYHFGTKQELMEALLDRVMDRQESELAEHLARSDRRGSRLADPEERILAYVSWVCGRTFDTADLLMFTDPRHRATLTQRWAGRLNRWLSVPEDVRGARRTRLLAARLMADGAWFASASGSGVVPLDARPQIESTAREILASPTPPA